MALDESAAAVIGSAVDRREDPALITGEAEYTDDITKHGAAHLALARSRYGHAEIESVDASAAEAVEGVLGVYTQDDVEASGAPGRLHAKEPEWATVPERTVLARDRVRYQGDPIAAVVAEDRYTAREAADLIEVEYDRLDAVTDPVEATSGGAPTLHDDAEDNVAFEWDVGDEAETEAALDSAAHVTELEFVNNRLIPTAMEPRAAVADYRPSTGHLTVEMTTQKPHMHQQDLSKTLGVPDHRIRVRAPAIGGGFGSKIQRYAGEALTAWAAMELDRPVKWQATRSEGFSSTAHGRDHVTRARIGTDEAGEVLAVRADVHANLGGYMSTVGAYIPTNFGEMLPGQYDFDAAYCHVTGAFTNTVPVDAYRGAGRPEATYGIERTINAAARDLGEDPVEFRRRNFIPPEEFPKEVPTGHTYDSGEYEKALDAALDAVDYEAFRERQARLREEGRYLGIGFSSYVEACGSGPGRPESALVRVHPSGTVTAYTGTADHGQGLETSFAQVVADRLGVDYDDVEIVDGDTAETPEGNGTSGSRSAAVAGSALVESAEKVIEQARRVAAHRLEAAPEDLDLADGGFHVAGAPGRSVSFEEVAAAAYDGDVPEGAEAGLEATAFYDPPNYTFPFGTHVAVVEVDPGSGEVEFERYVAVDDVGEQINPKIVEGQIHGGIAQGVGQALYEGAEYDDNANLLTGSMQDYTVPKAAHVPEMELDETVTPCPHNPLGVKGVGEAGTIAAPPAVVNAVLDALEPFGVETLDMPISEEDVWRAVRDAE